MLKSYQGKAPRIHPSAFVAEGTFVIGDVEIGENVGLWFGTTIRADINSVHIGRDTNIQEQTVIHVDHPQGTSSGKTIIGERVTVGHRALLHACTIGDDCLIGMGAIILSGAEIGAGSIVGAGAVVKEGMKVPPHSLVVGLPAVIKSQIPPERVAMLRGHAQTYVELARQHKAEG